MDVTIVNARGSALAFFVNLQPWETFGDIKRKLSLLGGYSEKATLVYKGSEMDDEERIGGVMRKGEKILKWLKNGV